MQYYIQNIPAVATLDFMYSCGGQINTSPYYYQWQNYYYNQKQVCGGPAAAGATCQWYSGLQASL